MEDSFTNDLGDMSVSSKKQDAVEGNFSSQVEKPLQNIENNGGKGLKVNLIRKFEGEGRGGRYGAEGQ